MPKFFDQLLEAALENRTSDPSNTPYGRVWLRTDTTPNGIKVRGSSATHNLFHSGVFTASGDTLYADASNSFARLAKGSNGQVLSLSAGLPAWVSPTITASVTTQTNNYTALSTDDVILCNTTTTAFTLTLPSAATTKIYHIKNIGTKNLTIDPNGSQTIDGALTKILPVQYQTLTIVSDGSNWHSI